MRMAIGFALEEGYDGIVVIDGNGKDDLDAVAALDRAARRGLRSRAGLALHTGRTRHQHAAEPNDRRRSSLHAPLISLAAGTSLHRYDQRLSRVQPAPAHRSARRSRCATSSWATSSTTTSRFAPRDLGFRVIETPVTRRYPARERRRPRSVPVKGNLLVLRTLGGRGARTIQPMTTGRGREVRRSSATRDSSAAICFAQRPFDALLQLVEHRPDRRPRASISSSAAGARAEKWKANADPERDLDNIERLAAAVTRASNAPNVVLISTVDVFLDPVGVDEDSPTSRRQVCTPTAATAVGSSRSSPVEFRARRSCGCPVSTAPDSRRTSSSTSCTTTTSRRSIRAACSSSMIRRGSGATSRSPFGHRLPLVHLPTEPVSVADVARAAFGIEFDNDVAPTPARYDMRHAARHAFRRRGRVRRRPSTECSTESRRSSRRRESRGPREARRLEHRVGPERRRRRGGVLVAKA